MANTYKTLYGWDWPKEMSDELIGLVVGKKWREYKSEFGFEFKDPWEPMLRSMVALYGKEFFKVSEWTEQHVHDWVTEPFLLTWGCASSSKALLLDEPVYYADHVGCVGEVKVGDRILDAKGGETEVVAIHDQVDAPLYTVEFSDGVRVLCSEDHLWTLHGNRVRVDPETRKRRLTPVTETVPAKYLAKLSPKVIRARSYHIQLTDPVAFSQRPVPLDPYVLGCLIGDGHMGHGHLTLASAEEDTELRDVFSSRLPDGYALRKTSKRRNHIEYSISNPQSLRKNGVVRILRGLGLYGLKAPDKFIPDMYKVNSVDVRVEIASGLLDTDGWASKDGRIGLKTTSKRLAVDFQFIMESLGGIVSIHAKPAHECVIFGKKRWAHESYEVLVTRLPLAMRRRLFKLSRKRDRVLYPDTSTTGARHLKSVAPVADRSLYPRETRCLTLAGVNSNGDRPEGLFPVGRFVVTHNSNDTGALIVADWLTDPWDTVTLVGSTTKDALRLRTWESIERYFKVLKTSKKFAIPGKITQTGYAILNDREADDSPQAQGAKAGIHGVALNDGGKLQGAHLPYVRLVVDELATVVNHQDILTTIENLQIAKDFRFIGLANPETWSNPSCQYAIPEGGVDSVDVDTGAWHSTFGCFVRHHDGLKSPCIKDPSLTKEFPFLVTQKHVDSALKRTGGNANAPHFWKMVRGFPLPSGGDAQVVLDPAVAIQQRAADPAPPFDPATWRGTCEGVDPAWTEDGDNACVARAFLRLDVYGRPYLDFTNGVRKFALDATQFSARPAIQQMRDQVIAMKREPYAAPFGRTAVDSSGNQALADELVIYAGATDILQVNSAERASEARLREADMRKTKDFVYDRGTEAWCVLAEFVRAGQVRGLPQEVVHALTTRRYAFDMVRDSTGLKRPAGVKYPLRLEKKAEFKSRNHGRSPDECDACALAALAAKERLGVVPFAYAFRSQEASASPFDAAFSAPEPPRPAAVEDYDARAEDVDPGEFAVDGVDDVMVQFAAGG